VQVPEQLGLALADRYRIERVIGEGGMATVYLAEDIRHRRNVALKALRPELAAVLGTERFLAEITVTANLQHPHLLPLFDSGEADGLLYYVMPYIEGETLRARLARERQLPVDEAVRIAAAVASALAYAHRHDVIHRDLKPENILLHEGQALVTDFGIALAVSNAASGRITQTGLSLGTPQYMSPEQATGDRTIDARSDIYSLGALTYEMLVGDPPHSAGTTQAIIAKVLTERPPGVRVYRDTVPVHVETAIQRALAKLPADRFATAVEFAEALTGARVVTPAASHPVPAGVDPDLLTTGDGRRGSRLTRALPWGVAAAALIVAGALALRPRAQPETTAVAFEVTFGDSVETWTHSGVTIAIARDGSRMAFTGRQRGIEGIYVRRLDGLSAELVRGTEGGTRPVLSPDGGALAFAARDGRLMKVALAVGAPAR
jgi:serine/threonine-protein kinase